MNTDEQNEIPPLKKRWRMKSSYVAALTIAVIVVVWVASGVGSSDDDGDVAESQTPASHALPQVQVTQMAAVERARELTLLGRTEAIRAVNIQSQTTGNVKDILVAKGDHVKEGQVLVRLETEDRAARVAQAKAFVEQQVLAFEAASKLSEQGFKSRLKLAESKANLESARAQLARAQADLAYATLRAPFAGTVEDLPVEVGSYLAKGTLVARMVDLDSIVVVGQVAERDAVHVSVGGLAEARLVGGEELTGVISFISRSSDASTRTFRIEITLESSEIAIAEGLTVEMRLPLDRVLAHRISPALLSLSQSGQIGVKAVDAQNRVVFYPIVMVADRVDGMWIGGLPAVVDVITTGQDFVRVGDEVVPVPVLERAPDTTNHATNEAVQ